MTALKLFVLTVMEWGEDIKTISEDEAVMLVNHQATGDVCTLMMCLQDKGLVSHTEDRDRLWERGVDRGSSEYLTTVGNVDLHFNMVTFPENLEKS